MVLSFSNIKKKQYFYLFHESKVSLIYLKSKLAFRFIYYLRQILTIETTNKQADKIKTCQTLLFCNTQNILLTVTFCFTSTVLSTLFEELFFMGKAMFFYFSKVFSKRAFQITKCQSRSLRLFKILYSSLINNKEKEKLFIISLSNNLF